MTSFCLGAIAEESAGIGNFQKVNTYREEQFSDVAVGAWYADGVKTAFELGLVKGTSSTAFNPSGNMTVYVETTAKGWEIGEMPEELTGKKAELW